MQLFPESQQRGPDKEVLWYREAMLWGVRNLSSITTYINQHRSFALMQKSRSYLNNTLWSANASFDPEMRCKKTHVAKAMLVFYAFFSAKI